MKSIRQRIPPASSYLQNLGKSSQRPKPEAIIPLCKYQFAKAMSISPSFRLFCSEIPRTLLHQPVKPNLQSLKVSPFSSRVARFFSVSPLRIERLPTKPIFSTPSFSPSATLQPIEELPPKLQEIIKLFQGVKEPKAKYDQLLFYGRSLEPLDAKFKNSENKVQGCVSQVWVRAYLDSDKNVIFQADSDSLLTKGLAALLVQGLSGRPVAEIVRVSPDFAVLLGLQQSLTPSRNNGFLNMLKLMQKKALQLYVQAEMDGSAANGSLSGPADDSRLTKKSDEGNGDTNSELSSTEAAGDVKRNNGSNGDLGSRGLRIKEKLQRELKPIELEVEDTSYQHAGHAGARGSDGETHFNVRVVSGEFEGKSLVKRHRLIYDLLQDELQSGLHALSIEAKTPSEVNK